MKVDRKRYLHLVAVIAGTTAACGAKQEPQASIIVPADGSKDASAPPLATVTDAAPPAAPASPASSPRSSASRGIWSLPYDASKKPYACSDFKCPGPTVEASAMSALRHSCKTIQSRLKTEPFQRFMTCMMLHNNTDDACSTALVDARPGDCLEGWAETANVDSAMAAKCKPLVTACAGQSNPPTTKELTSEDCMKMLSITNPSALPKMIHCIAESCDYALLYCHGGLGG